MDYVIDATIDGLGGFGVTTTCSLVNPSRRNGLPPDAIVPGEVVHLSLEPLCTEPAGPLETMDELRAKAHARGNRTDRFAPRDPSFDAALAAVDRVVRERAFRVEGRVPTDARVRSLEATFDRYGDAPCRPRFELEVVLPDAIPFPFTPGRVAPAEPLDRPFWRALGAARNASQLPCIAAEIVETESYWIFPVRQIGTLGTIVDRRGHRAYVMGSHAPREAHVWAWEQGLVERDTPFVIASCTEPAAFVERVRHCYPRLRAETVVPGTELPWDVFAIDVFYEMRDVLRVT